jgi:hypothetical protein
MNPCLPRAAAVACLLWLALTPVTVRADAVTFTNDATISPVDFSVDGADIVVAAGKLVVDGAHAFNSIHVLSGATLTHTFTSNGLLSVNFTVTNEPHILTGTNPAVLIYSNVDLSTLLVTDNSGTFTYTNPADYMAGTVSNRFTSLQRSLTSTIPDGATVFVTYGATNVSVPTGLNVKVTNDVIIDVGGAINAAGGGYANGPGAGRQSQSSAPDGSGAGHGGYGGLSSSNAPGGGVYDAVYQPVDKGSSGGAGTGGAGGYGGGAIQFVVGGAWHIDGLVSVNGANGTNSRSGGGSGGSIYVVAQTLAGSGSITANGGAGEPIHGGGGGGGCIAIYYATNIYSGAMSAYGGNGFIAGGAGTIVLNDTNAAHPQLIIDNGGKSGTNSLVSSAAGVDVTIRNGARVFRFGSAASVRLSSNAWITVAGQLYALLDVDNDVTIGPGCGIVGDGAGFPMGLGSGHGSSVSVSGTFYGSGGGHGGYGGDVLASASGGGLVPGGTANDSGVFPGSLGSGGGGSGSTFLPFGGTGGGGLRLTVGGTLTLDGKISMNGTSANGPQAGGGSGGSIFLIVGTFAGAGTLSANGGSGVGVGGGGGGGRIGVQFATNVFSGSATAFGGTGGISGGAGTIAWYTATLRPDIIVDNGGNAVTNSAYSSLGSPGAGTRSLIIRGGAAALYDPGLNAMSSLVVNSNAAFVISNSAAIAGVTASNVIVDAGGEITGDRLGFTSGLGSGPGHSVGTLAGGGAGHGGYGGDTLFVGQRVGGVFYDSVTIPGQSGSGGGPDSKPGGAGGAAFHLTVNGTLLLNGTMSMNGGNGIGLSSGGGAGGSLWLQLGTLAGNGALSANGGSSAGLGGGGAGGRIAITMNTNLFTGVISNSGGTGGNAGAAGTVYLQTAGHTGQLIIDNAGLSATNTSWSSLPVGLDVTVKNGGKVFLADSSLLSVVNSVLIGSGANLTISNPIINAGSITIQAGGALTADSLGFPAAQGPGAGGVNFSTLAGSGASYGGFGANNVAFGGGGTVYGSVTAPVDRGSGGGNGSSGGTGGGLLRLTANSLTVDGTLSANGGRGSISSAGGGSGGSVVINAGTLHGSGLIAADGGAGGANSATNSGGGGGGGRVAIQYSSNAFTGTLSARGGVGVLTGGAGTIYLKGSNEIIGHVIVDNGGQSGTNTPLANASSPFLPTDADVTLRNGAIVRPSTLSVTMGNLTIAPGGILTISPAQATNGLILLVASNFNIASGGLVALDGRGYLPGTGAGCGTASNGFGSGAGYGGNGGASASAPGGSNYGSMFYPADPGSGGGSGSGPVYPGSEGGGAAHLDVGGSLTVNGWIDADGHDGIQDSSGGGSGGGIWINTRALAGAGTISAAGGFGDLYNGGGGAGGRIAVYVKTNSFAGSFDVSGGDGFQAGGLGTIYFATNAVLSVISQSPTGTVTSGVLAVGVNFSGAVDAGSFTVSDLGLNTPNGPLAPDALSLHALTPFTYEIDFPLQTANGNYALNLGPNISDIYGGAMSQVYTGSFTIFLPVVQGTVTDTNGSPVSGVTLLPSVGSFATSDVNGNYSVGAAPGVAFTVTATNGVLVFVPGSRSYTNVTTSVSNQNYIAVTSLAPTLGSSVQSTNLVLTWYGIPGATYQPFYSTNLIDWLPYGGTLSGSNNTVQFMLPIGPEPRKFLRVQANN